MDKNLVVGTLTVRAKSLKDIIEKFGERGVFTEWGKGYYQGLIDGLSDAIDIVTEEVRG